MKIDYSGSDTLILENRNKSLEITVFDDGHLMFEAEDDDDRHTVTIVLTAEAAGALEMFLQKRKGAKTNDK